MTSNIIRDKQRRDTNRKAGGNVTTEAEAGVKRLQAKECLAPPETEKDITGFSPVASGR